ncbi:MAG: cytochrome c [Deltaproteobacteria bacterium]
MLKINKPLLSSSLVITALTVLIISLFTVRDSYGQNSPHDMENMGRDLFIENRCVRCHTIGRGRFVGPDLKGVGERYSREEIIKWIENPQQIYQSTGKMPVNEGYPPMPPMQIHPMAASAITDYLLTVKVKPDAGEGGAISGKVVNKTNDEAASGINITLTSFMGDKETGKTEAVTEPGGEFAFRDLSWDRSYAVTVRHKDAEYSTDKMVFYPGEDTKTLELPVYEPTTSDADITVKEAHMIVQVMEEGLSIADLSIFENKGDKMYTGSMDIGEGKKETIRFSVPEEAGNINFIHGLDPGSVVRTENGFSDSAGVLPGDKRVVFAYNLPLDSGDTSIDKTIEYPTGSFLLLVSDTGSEIEVDGLSGQEAVEIENEKFLRWTGADLKPGHEIIITFINPRDYSEYLKWAALGFIVLLVGAGIIYSSVRGGKSKSQENKPVTRESLLDKRSSLIREIAALDDRFEAGGVEEERYRKLRESKKAELVEITRRLRF